MRGGLRFSHVALKGFVFVTLDAKSHHAEFIKVNTHCVPTVREAGGGRKGGLCACGDAARSGTE